MHDQPLKQQTLQSEGFPSISLSWCIPFRMSRSIFLYVIISGTFKVYYMIIKVMISHCAIWHNYASFNKLNTCQVMSFMKTAILLIERSYCCNILVIIVHPIVSCLFPTNTFPLGEGYSLIHVHQQATNLTYTRKAWCSHSTPILQSIGFHDTYKIQHLCIPI